MLPGKWTLIGAGFAILALSTVLGVQTLRLSNRTGERDVARTELAGVKIELQTSRIDTKVATDAVEVCATEFNMARGRFTAALNSANDAAERARRAARGCVTDEAVAARLGAAIK